jgi:hypothetical protein
MTFCVGFASHTAEALICPGYVRLPDELKTYRCLNASITLAVSNELAELCAKENGHELIFG